MADEAALRNLRGRARAPHPRDAVGSGSIWFGGNVSRYYDSLLAGEKRKLRPQQIETLAVHRWLGARRSTTEHYKLVHSALARLPRAARVMDAGCGVGGAMLWLEQREPAWQLVGHTVSEEQHGWAERVCKQKVPPCRFTVQLRSYDAPMGSFNAIYSIEALIHSPDVGATLQAWSRHLEPGGAVAVIDDFLADHPPPTVLREPEIARALAAFRSGWLAVGLCSPARLAAAAAAAGLRLVENRNIGEEYQVVARNYRSLAPKLPNESEWKSHQGWFGSIARRILTVRGVVEYRLLVLAKVGAVPLPSRRRLGQIESRHMSGVGRSGGSRMACISPWYCCGQGVKLWDEMNATRTDSLSFLRLPRAIFGNYMENTMIDDG
ncbi:hypothetical protein EMIHUDRAFT_236144 [Emiliania huxleyi CCMP1516]|uniref:Polyketide synthase-like methyltransferase domain-containing protein n=2 Tax=Emiliania huxleyi TaxID=2903 RepID=A0A0D3JTY2_EMIH1|nr:hypothetical protein EMIHUDRAFT_236144 [Emiliania huxleyi CCMP1516]EOD26967.1 hypothetical protein EMIHUDRAFT_236144 [Emiliania huxleyi CCMP1516]|eukprot:XP_005779396.1 hypothetical protein EMIHUDRAFT_236144 [Emiliania huxleyi CCMP1516]